MTREEKIRACAKLMGLEVRMAFGWPHIPCMHHLRDTSDEQGSLKAYAPYTDDAQAMALVKKLKLTCDYQEWSDGWYWVVSSGKFLSADKADLNTAIVDCAAQIAERGGRG